MTQDDKRHYWVIHMSDYDIDWEAYTVKDLRKTFIDGLKKKIKYYSVINEKGENTFTTVGHKAEDLNDKNWIEVHDEEGNLNIIETANVITKDFLDNNAIIAMRFEKEMYDELGEDTSWINNILGDD